MPATKRRANQPAIPPVSIETWKAVLAAADDFNRLAPWDWMHDSQIVGLRHPVTKEVLLGSIRVQRPRVAAMLSRVAMELGIPVLQDAELPALNSVRDDMESRFRR